MAIIRPRLNDYYGIPLLQDQVDFAIPFLDEDLPLYVDPFILWKSPSQQDNSLHDSIIKSINYLGHLFVKGNEEDAINILIELSECNEVGLGCSSTKQGKKIGKKPSHDILSLYKNVPQLHKQGFQHFEEIQLLVDGISKDRISDITCSLLKSFLIDYTIQNCITYKIPVTNCTISRFDLNKKHFIQEDVSLPINPENKRPLLFVPKRWLRYVTWINYEDYFDKYYIKDINAEYKDRSNRIPVLEYNRHNYDAVHRYMLNKEKNSGDCKNDPLFSQIPVLSAKRTTSKILKLPTGKTDNADRDYEDLMVKLLSSLLYPHLDFAQDQSRTESGSQIRDLIFYNNRSLPFLQDIYDNYQSKQLIIELKNVNEVEREHINQLNRYLTDQFGDFGIIFTRNKPSKAMLRNTIDLWSGHRKCILIMDDNDIKLMCNVFVSKQRKPVEVLLRKYIEFTRLCPG
jgi:hypothetical protein